MKKKVFYAALITVAASSFIGLSSFTSNSIEKSSKQQRWGDEDLFFVGPDLIVRASDGTVIEGGPQGRTIRICPGWGRPCVGSATIDNKVYSYNGSKGIFQSDIVIYQD